MAEKTLDALATDFMTNDRPVGTVIPAETVKQMAIAAARKYAAYGFIASLIPPESTPPPAPPSNPFEVEYLFPPVYGFPLLWNPSTPPIVPGKPIAPVDWVEISTVINQSEWGVIRPLFLLYVEREQAIFLEASRSFGAEVFGRSSSEIAQDITQYEERLPMLAFCQPAITV